MKERNETFDLRNKIVMVVGLGRSGFAAADFLLKKKIHVRVTEAARSPQIEEKAHALRRLGAEVETLGHTRPFLHGVDLVVTSPGVPKDSLPLRLARRKKIPVVSEVELAFYFCPGTVIGITGSNGKTTTSHLLHEILVRAGRKSVLCGNVGRSFINALGQIDEKTIVVLELSSFQLEDCTRLRVHGAVLLNIQPNHLDRHGMLLSYARAKKRIFMNQTSRDFAVVNCDDVLARAAAAGARSRVTYFSHAPLGRGVFERDGAVYWKDQKAERKIFEVREGRLEGSHNVENRMAAAAAALHLGVRPGVIRDALRDFQPLRHRIEPVGEVKGVRFVNDSKSTTVDSTRAAVLSVSTPLILLAGGRDKGAPFHQIEAFLEDRVKLAVFYGEARKKIAGALRRYRRVRMARRFEEAVRLAYRAASPGDTLLLSPMCASFDEFQSYEHRGDTFKRIFHDLKRS